MPNTSRPWPKIVRERMSMSNCLQNLEWAETELRKLNPEREIPALKEYAAIQKWKLDKLLPDLKHLEVSGTLRISVK
jgi:hypothetical protein